jgi:hypothetical protein
MCRSLLSSFLLILAGTTHAFLTVLPGNAGQAGDKSSLIKVEQGKSLSFDPKTCTQGQATVAWGLGSTSVKVLGHKDGFCVFEVKAEVEGGYTVYLCKVPLDSGPVTIEVGLPAKTSFALDKCKIVRGGNVLNGWRWLPVENSDHRVHYQDQVAGKGKAPQPGDKVRVVVRLFADGQFKELLPGTKPANDMEFTVGHKDAWPWLQAAVTDLQPGGKRLVWIDGKIADGAKNLVPNFTGDQRLYLEVELVSVTPGKQ